MKKLLSILLALSMIISCVSMMTFVVNAEDTPAGVKIEVTQAGTSCIMGPGNLNKEMRVDGKITKNFEVYNPSELDATFEVAYASNTGWNQDIITEPYITIPAGGKTTVKMEVPCDDNGYYNGTIAVSDFYLRINMREVNNVGASIIVATENNPEVASIKFVDVGNGAAASVTPVDELPTNPVGKKISGGDTIVTGVFENVEIDQGSNTATAQFAIFSDNDVTFTINPVHEWHQCTYAEPGKSTNSGYAFEVSVTLTAGEVKFVKVTVPATYYLGKGSDGGTTVDDAMSSVPYECTNYDIRIKGLGSNVIYIVPFSYAENASNWKMIYTTGTIGNAASELWYAPFEVPEGKFEGANLDIGSTLTMNYVASVAKEYVDKDLFVEFTRNNKTDKVYPVKQYDGSYKFAYTGINAQCMGDNITAKLYSGDVLLATYDQYSVKEYATRKYGTASATLKTLLADMLAYGAASQTHTGYNDDNLVNDGLNWECSEFKKDNHISGKNIISNGGTYRVKSAGMEISNVYKIYFTLEGDATGAEVYVDNKEVTVDSNGRVYTYAIAATGNKDIHTIVVEIGGVETSRIEYNVDAYISAKYDDPDVGEIVQKIANYSQSAQAYAANH